MSAAPVASAWRGRIVAAAATLVALAILVALGMWQLERKAWKEGLIAQIEARAYGEPAAPPVPAEWEGWSAAKGEYARVRLLGTFQHDKEVAIHGLMPGQRGAPVQGFYVFTPMRLQDGATIVVNRGFVPTELRSRAVRQGGETTGEVAVTGLVRAPERRGWFVPPNDPGRDDWFVRDLGDIAQARGLERIAPFYVDADSTPNPGGWPRGGQTRLALTNDHLQYALTWFGLALTLLGVAGASAFRRARPRAVPIEEAGHQGPA